MAPGTVSRRRLLGTLGAGGAIALTGCVGGDGETSSDDGTDDDSDASEETDSQDGGTTASQGDAGLTVGVLQDITGPLGPGFAQQGLIGFLSGLAYKDTGTPPSLPGDLSDLDGETISYSVNGTDVTLEVRDTRSDPQDAQRLATELVGAGVDVLFGFSNSTGLTRYLNLAIDDNDVPLFVAQASAGNVTTDRDLCHRQLFRATETTSMTARAGGRYIANDVGIQRVALFGTETSYGKAQLANYRAILGDAGVEIVAEEVVSPGYSNWEQHLQSASDSGADAVVYAMAGETGRLFAVDFATGSYGMRAIGDMPSQQTLVPLGQQLKRLAQETVGSKNITRGLIESIQFGPFTDRYHWNQYDNEINDWFVEAAADVYGVRPDLFTSSAFASASAIVQAIEAAGEPSSDAITGEVHGMSVEATPKGPGEYVFDERTNQARSPITIAPLWPIKDDYWPVLVGPGDPFSRIPKEETAIPADDPNMTCTLS